MKNHEQSIIFLQEFTYKFDEFFKVDGVTVNKDEFASTIMAKESKGESSSIPAFRYFTMTYDSKTFHVYIGQIGHSVIATIYSETFHNGPADAFFVGNLAAGNLKSGSDASNAESYDLAYTFSGTSDKSSRVTETPTPSGAFGGNRPFIILRFDTKPCVLVNVHVPHGGSDDVFRDISKNATGKPTGTLADFAFNALQRFIPDTVFKDTSKNKDEYAFILGGDFNTNTPKIDWLKESTTPAVTRTTGTCCTTEGGTDFTTQGAFDHIFSTLPITKYTVHDITSTAKTSSPPPERYYFSDHLPVYAEINFTDDAPTPHAASSS
jgi:exonuclease III